MAPSLTSLCAVALGVVASAASVAAAPRALLQIGDSPPPAWQFNVFDVDTDEVTVHPSDPFNPRYDVFKDWRLQHPCYQKYMDSDTDTSDMGSDSNTISVSSSDTDTDTDEDEACPLYPVGWPHPVRLVRQTMNVIGVMAADAKGSQYAVAAQGDDCADVHGEGWEPAQFSVQSFDDQQPMVIQALDASVGENVEAMTGVQSANGNCMMVRSVGDSTAVWEEQECAAGADMPTVCRQSQGDDDEGHTFVATYDEDVATVSAEVDFTPAVFFAGCMVATALIARGHFKSWRKQQANTDLVERQPLAPHMKSSTGSMESSSPTTAAL